MAGVTGTYSLQDAAFGRWFGEVSNSGKSVNEQTMMSISAAWGCVRILTETIAALPWGVYQMDKTGNSVYADMHPLNDVLVSSPNIDMTSMEFREAQMLGITQRGNGYSMIERSGPTVTSLTPIKAANCVPAMTTDGELQYKVLDRGQWEVYPREKIWHVKGFGDGMLGLSPLAAAREAFGTALATEEFGSKFFSNGGAPSGIVTVPNFFKEDQRKIARENLQQVMGGLGNAHKFALFEGGMKPEPWGGMPLDDMQFILLRGFSVDEICRFYRVPPHMVAKLDRATFSNIEQMSLEFVMFTLMPYFVRFESSASKWLFKPADRSKYRLRFNFEGLLRADSAARAEFLAKMLQNGVMTRNEARAKENLNRSEDDGMDDYTVQTNLTVIDMLEPLAQATIDKSNQPAPVVGAAATVDANVADSAGDAAGKSAGASRVELTAIAALAKKIDDVKEVALRGQVALTEAMTDFGKALAAINA
jgi:HK97 family phage portal protein